MADALCPLRSSSYAKNKPPWLSKELIELSKDKDRALNLARVSKNHDDKQFAKTIRNRCNIAFRMAKRRYILDNLTEFADNPKKFWQHIREILPKKHSQSLLTLFDDQSGHPITHAQTADYINNFFAQVGP